MARKLHRSIHFDVSHHVTFGNDWILSFIGALLPVPFVWGPVGGGQKTPKGLMSGYSGYGRLAEVVRYTAQWFGRKDYFRRRCARKAKAILVCNHETKNTIPRKYEAKTHFFPVNGIAVGDVSGEPPPAIDKFIVITAGRFHRLKGFDLAIRSFALFVSRFSGSELVIIGNGPEERRLSRLINDLRLENKARIVPWMPREAVLKTMRSSHVFLFPSFRDGGGAVVVEAMACGKPVICLDVGGPGFHVQKEWGIKIPPLSPEFVVKTISSSLELLYENHDLRESLGRAARSRVMDFYVWDRLGERLANIYQSAFSAGDIKQIEPSA